MFAWETTRQEDNMAASEWEDASCLQPRPYTFFLSRVGVCPTLGFVLTLPLTILKTESIPIRLEYFEFLEFAVPSVRFPLSYCIRDLLCRLKFSNFNVIV